MSEVVQEGGVTAGALLRDARQAAGVHIAALAVALKVPVSKLEALEADNYQALPDTVFVRALASSMCRTLKLDPAPVLSLLPQSQSPRLSTHDGGLNAPVRGSHGKSSPASLASSFPTRSASRSVSLLVMALLAGALVLVFLPRQQEEDMAPRGGEPAGASTTAVEPTPGAATPSAPVPQPAPPAAAMPGAQPSAEGRVDAVSPSAPPPVASGAASAPVDAASAAPPPGGVLVLRARGESWVQVRDANGALALQRNLASGEVVSISAPAPLAVVVGRADVTEVLVRGKVLDLTALSRENVARFEVK